MKKQLIKFSYFIARFIGKILFYIYPLRLSAWVDVCMQHIYTARISSLFKKFGSCSSIHRKATVIGGKYISIGNDVCIMKDAILTAWEINDSEEHFVFPEITFGDGTVIGEQSHITAIHKISIGKNVLSGRCLTITDNGHGDTNFKSMDSTPRQRPLYSKGPVIIEDNVWLGDKVTVLPGVTIGRNSIVGANAVVTKNIPPFSIVGGNPGKIIKTLSSQDS